MNKRYLTYFQLFIAATAMLFSAAIFAQSSLIVVKASVDKTVLTVGDPIKYSLEINRREGVELRDPAKGSNIGAFEVREFQPLPERRESDRIIQKFEYTLAVYDTGTYIIPSYPVAFLPPDSLSDGDYQIIDADPITITVKSVIEAENAELEDIRPPFGLPGNLWWIWAIVTALLIGLAVWYFFFRKKTDRPKALFKKEVIRPAHEIALEELDHLLQSDLLKTGKHKAFYSILSDILRRYVEGRFYIRALEETTGELVESLEQSQIESQQATHAIDALHMCDLVKFAKFIPGSDDTDKTVALVRKFIEETRLEFAAVEKMQRIEPAETESKTVNS